MIWKIIRREVEKVKKISKEKGFISNKYFSQKQGRINETINKRVKLIQDGIKTSLKEFISLQNLIEIMHKKRDSAILKSMKNLNAFKKKTSKILKSLSPLPILDHESALKQKEIDDLTKSKQLTERTRMITSEYALNYKETNKQLTLCKTKKLYQYPEKQTFKNTNLLLSSAFDICSQEKSISWSKYSTQKMRNRNLSVQCQSWIKKKQSQVTKEETKSNYFDSYRKKRYMTTKNQSAQDEVYLNNIKRLEIVKRESQSMLYSIFKKIQNKEDELQEERQKFKMMEDIYQSQIKKLTNTLSNSQTRNYCNKIINSQKCISQDKKKEKKVRKTLKHGKKQSHKKLSEY